MHAIKSRLWALIAVLLVIGVFSCGVDPFSPPVLPEHAQVSVERVFTDALVSDVKPYGDFLVITTGVDRQIRPAIATDALESSLQVLNRETLETVGRLPLHTDPQDVVIVGKTAYVASGDALIVVDLSVPTAPMVAISIPTEKYARTVGYTSGLLIVGQGTGTLEELTAEDWPQLWVLDVGGDPHKPVSVGTLRAKGQVSGLTTTDDGWVFAAEWDAGVGAYNVVAFADAGKETTRHYPVNDGSVDGVAVNGGRLYAAMVGGEYIGMSGEIRVFDARGSHLNPVASTGIDAWVRTIVPRDEYVLYVGVDPTGSEIGAAAPEWGLDPVILANYRNDSWEFALDLVQSGESVDALVARPTGTLDFSAGGCAVQINQLDTSLRRFEIE